MNHIKMKIYQALVVLMLVPVFVKYCEKHPFLIWKKCSLRNMPNLLWNI